MNQGGHLCLLNPKPTPPDARGRTKPRFRQHRSASARSHRTGATSTPTSRTARPLRRRLGPVTRRSGPAGPGLPRGAAGRPRPAGPRAAPASTETRGRPAGRLREFRRGRGSNIPQPISRPAGRPGGSGTSRAKQAARVRRPASRPRWGRGRCYLPGLGRFLPAPLSWQPRQRHGGREPEGLVTAPGVHRARARAHAGVDVLGPRSPPPVRSLPPGASCSHSALKRTVGEAAHHHQLRERTCKGV